MAQCEGFLSVISRLTNSIANIKEHSTQSPLNALSAFIQSSYFKRLSSGAQLKKDTPHSGLTTVKMGLYWSNLLCVSLLSNIMWPHCSVLHGSTV